jgi:hypothetical protein
MSPYRQGPGCPLCGLATSASSETFHGREFHRECYAELVAPIKQMREKVAKTWIRASLISLIPLGVAAFISFMVYQARLVGHHPAGTCYIEHTEGGKAVLMNARDLDDDATIGIYDTTLGAEARAKSINCKLELP